MKILIRAAIVLYLLSLVWAGFVLALTPHGFADLIAGWMSSYQGEPDGKSIAEYLTRGLLPSMLDMISLAILPLVATSATCIVLMAWERGRGARGKAKVDAASADFVEAGRDLGR